MNQNTTNPEPGFDWIDGQRVMQMLELTKEGLKNWRRHRKITYSNVNGKLLYLRSEIIEMIEHNKKIRELKKPGKPGKINNAKNKRPGDDSFSKAVTSRP
jgi:hypothetical protein